MSLTLAILHDLHKVLFSTFLHSSTVSECGCAPSCGCIATEVCPTPPSVERICVEERVAGGGGAGGRRRWGEVGRTFQKNTKEEAGLKLTSVLVESLNWGN